MENQETAKTPIVASKSFMAVGPTLHYSHENVQRCWLLAVAAFALSCLFWSKIVNGAFWTFDFEPAMAPSLWNLGQSITTGVSIFEYPWQILVVGLLMGILCVVPVLISQLMSFRYSLLFILGVFLLANLPGFAICLLISCFAVACRPFRFRSRFIAMALCTAPQLIYWGFLGGARGVEPIKWGFSFSPWVCAWFVGLGIAGVVLGVGHYTRYRPGLVWAVTTFFLLLAIVTFEMRIGFDELDYQLYVAKNNPEQAAEFHDHSIREALDITIREPAVKKYLAGFFYPVDEIVLREELKSEIQDKLNYDRWPAWFIVPEELRYQVKRRWLQQQYDLFISKRPQSPRMPIALYYKAFLSEYRPDIKVLGQKEMLHFYNDYPHQESLLVWYRLYENFPESGESLEARWRIAKDWVGRAEFELADKLLADSQRKIAERMEQHEKETARNDTFFGLFRPPPESAMTTFKLADLQRRVNQLRSLIGPENRTGEPETDKLLARFVMLNPHATDYAQGLDKLLEQTSDRGLLCDNILLAQIKLVADEQLRAEKFARLHRDFQGTDGGMQALYELARLKIDLYQSESEPERKREYLSDARALLTSFISLYPDSFCAEQVKENLSNLPNVE